MRRASLRSAIPALVAAVVVVSASSSSAHAASLARTGSTGGSAAAVMLGTSDLPDGYQPDASLTGPLTGSRARVLGAQPGQFGTLDSWMRAWQRPGVAKVIEVAVQVGTHDIAREVVESAATRLVHQGAARQPLTGPVGPAYGEPVEVSGTQEFELVFPLARGPYYFSLYVFVLSSSPSSASPLMSRLAAAQVDKVPADTPDTADSGDLAPYVAGAVTGVLLMYMLLADGIAYLRNPLRRRRLTKAGRYGPVSDAADAADVSAAAKRDKRIAIARLAVQLGGVGLAACAIDRSQVPYWYAYPVVGLTVAWAGGRFIRPGGTGRDRAHTIMAGSHWVLVSALLAVGSIAVLFGLAIVCGAGLFTALPPGLPEKNGFGPGWTTAQSLSSNYMTSGLILLVLGAIIYRYARRLGSIDARRLLERDSRPPVLYLRAFGDDRLRLWTATLGRSSLIERFTLRRFDRFEEVLVRHLSQYGPVIAVNPPGTKLAPLGAARQTIDNAEWHEEVAGWMAECALIVFLTPPIEVREGLRWELRTVSEHGYWDKTLVVVPPVPANQLHDRWQGFRAACGRFWPFTVTGAVTDSGALTLAFRDDRWQVTRADRRTEWTYGAAFNQALGHVRHPTIISGHDVRPEAHHRRLTWRPAALIAAAVSVLAVGLGTWYAVGRASPAHRLTAATSSSSPVATPSSPVATSPASPAASSSPPAGTVPLTDAAAQYPAAAAIQAVVTQYFTAINDRDYGAYVNTQSQENALTEAQFEAGFRSTQDSDAVSTSITTGSDERPAAEVVFTSHQQPEDGPGGESCTNWQVILFFDTSTATYTIDTPPASYHAIYQACP